MWSLKNSAMALPNWNQAQAENRMLQMIGQHQNQIELVLANNDAMALGAIDAYKKTEPDRISPSRIFRH